MIFVGSSGNDSKNSVNYPAALHTAIGVGATDAGDSRWGDSNHGPRLDIVAPSEFYTTARNGGYRVFGGTSQAAPVVSGIAGLIFSEGRDENHNLSNNDVVHLLERTADNVQDMNGDFDTEYGHGRVNAYEALRRLNDPYDVTHGTASFTKIYNDDSVSFPDGFAKENGSTFGAGTYICDIYKLRATSSSSYSYEEKPWFWLPVTERGFSAANPNYGNRYLSKSVSKSSAEATTYFYYVETNVNGQEIGWVPFDPTVHKRNGSFEYTVIGKPGPVNVTLSGTTDLANADPGTWTAYTSGGRSPFTYQWYEKKETESSYSLISGVTGDSYTASYYEPVSLKVEVTAEQSSDTDVLVVDAQFDDPDPPPCGGGYACQQGATLELEQFESTTAGSETVTLQWRPSNTGDRPFTLQRASGTSSPALWSNVGTVEAGSNPGPVYRFTDRDLPYAADTLRYRLQRQSPQGAMLLSRPVAVQRPAVSGVTLRKPFPNPATGQVTIPYAVPKSADGEARLSVYDIMGRKVHTVRLGSNTGRNQVRLSVSEFASGTYVVRLSANGAVKSKRLTVLR